MAALYGNWNKKIPALRDSIVAAIPELTTFRRVVESAELDKPWGDLCPSGSGITDAVGNTLRWVCANGGLDRLSGRLVEEAPGLREVLAPVLAAAQHDVLMRRYRDALVERHVLQMDSAPALRPLVIEPRGPASPVLVSAGPGSEAPTPLNQLARKGARLLVVEGAGLGGKPELASLLSGLGSGDGEVGEPLELLPVVIERWAPGEAVLWTPDLDPGSRKAVEEEQRRSIREGNALLIGEGWDGATDDPRLRPFVENGGNVVLLGAGGHRPPPAGFQVLHALPLGVEDRRLVARRWLTPEDAEALLVRIDAAEQLAEVSRAPYVFTAICVAERLQREEIRAWSEGTSHTPIVPARAMDQLIRAMWSGAPLPGATRAREATRELLDLARVAHGCLLRGEHGIEPTALDAELTDAARSTGLLVAHARGDHTVYTATHPAIWDALVAHALANDAELQRDVRKVAACATRSDRSAVPRWAALLARVADLLEPEVHGASLDAADHFLWGVMKEDHSLGLGTLSRCLGPTSSHLLQTHLHVRPLPDRWSGYRPDRWRVLESRLRLFEKLRQEAIDDDALVRIFKRVLARASSFDLAVIRLCISDMCTRYGQSEEELPAGLQELGDARRFFEIAGRPPYPANLIRWVALPSVRAWTGAGDEDTMAWRNERPRHREAVEGFKMSMTTVTNAQYQVFDPTWRKTQEREVEPAPLPADWERLPATRISYYEAWIFAEWASATLPSEAQWERAAWGYEEMDEAPRPLPYWFTSDAQFVHDVWFRDNSDGRPHPPDEPPPSASDPKAMLPPFGLQHMLGNVWEWCEDEQGYRYPTDADPVPSPRSPFKLKTEGRYYLFNRVIRGGSWDSEKDDCRCSARQFAYPAVRSDVISFRLVKR